MTTNGKTWASTLAKWLAGGTGAVIAVYVLDQLRGEGIVAVLKAWGPGFGLGIAALLILDRRAGQFISEQRRLVEAQAGLTGAVQQLVERDDREAQATKAAIGFVAQQQEEIMRGIAEIKDRLPEKE